MGDVGSIRGRSIKLDERSYMTGEAVGYIRVHMSLRSNLVQELLSPLVFPSLREDRGSRSVLEEAYPA